MLRFGIVSELGTGEWLGYCRVSFDEVKMVSFWLPILSGSTKTSKSWNSIEVGSQIACLMDKECEQGVALSAIWSDKDKPPDFANDKTVGIQFADGAKLYYDFDAKKGFLEAPETSLKAVIKEADIEASDKVKLKCETLELTGDLKVTGDATITGDVSVTGGIDATNNIKSKMAVEGLSVKATLGAGTTLSTHMHPTAATGPPSPPTPGT